ncbi:MULTISPECIES: hypothetical protein [Brevibacillus]|nr:MULTISPECIES: hypothetical protein [Brevibacillus]MDH6350309.1 hypothetical protein [Brevibacillus sp. 1238]MDR5001873.1 hypothetical protein [Brevibacillus parabrevis]
MRVPIHAKIHGLPKNAYKTVALASALNKNKLNIFQYFDLM